MESSIKFLALVISCAQVAYMATISEIQANIASESLYIDGAIGASRSAIYQGMTTSRSVLNVRAESLKSEINFGPVLCKLYNEQITSIQEYQVNFVYEYQPCEYVSRLNKMTEYKTTLAEQKKIADLIAVLCVPVGNATISGACTNQINVAYNNLNGLHQAVVNAIAGINRDVGICIPSKQREINTMLDTVYAAWKNCQIV